MNKKDNLKFEKTIKKSQNHNSTRPQSQREAMKIKIMDKYNISPEEADKVLNRVEKKRKMPNYQQIILNNEKDNSNYNHAQQSSKQKSNINKTTQQHNLEKETKNLKNNKNTKSPNSNKNINQKKINNKKESTKSKSYTPPVNQNSKQPHDINQQNSKNVDNIIEDIIPDYNQQVSIDVNHVDLTFEVPNEKVDTLKETFIRTVQRKKNKKIKIHALKDISFKIYKGEKVGIIGYNGAGKSTLLNVITGIYTPDKGSVTTNGNISPLLSLGAGFDHNFSGRKNIFLNGAVLGYDKEFLESKMDEIIEFSELGEYIDIPIKNYSSGMLAKLGFSIATSVDPDILIIDEVLGVGDVTFRKKSSDRIRSLMDGGTTVLLVSHSIAQIRELCDKAIWIEDGKLREFGEVNKVCDHYLKAAEKATNEQLANIQLK